MWSPSHSPKIVVFSDLKPMNILLADSRTKAKRNSNAGDANVLQLFDEELYIAKISDVRFWTNRRMFLDFSVILDLPFCFR